MRFLIRELVTDRLGTDLDFNFSDYKMADRRLIVKTALRTKMIGVNLRAQMVAFAEERLKKMDSKEIYVALEGRKYIDGIPDEIGEERVDLLKKALPDFLRSKGRSMLIQGKQG